MAMNPTFNFHRPQPDARRAWRRRRVLALCGTAALLTLAGAPAARAGYANARPVQVEVIDRDSGEPLQVYRDRGRPVVAGRPGARYAVRLVNTSGERVLAVVAIDGVNVVSGETAAVGQRGYVLEPWQGTSITGWRKSNDEVAAFEFTALADSYAARTGRPFDVGVIGVAVFREAQPLALAEEPPRPRLDGLAKSQQAPAAAAAQPAERPAYGAAAPQPILPGDNVDADRRRSESAAAPAERLGTGHGAREASPVRITTFQRATTQPSQRVEIRYDSYDNLVAAGIVRPPRMAVTRPRPFPADPPRGDYVADPPVR
jgi:hypothetical protein